MPAFPRWACQAELQRWRHPRGNEAARRCSGRYSVKSVGEIRAVAPGGHRAFECDVHALAEEEWEPEIERAAEVRGLSPAVGGLRAGARAEVIEEGTGWVRVERRVRVPDRELHRRLHAVEARIGRLQIELRGGAVPRVGVVAVVARIAAAATDLGVR